MCLSWCNIKIVALLKKLEVSFNFRGEAGGGSCVKDSLWLSLIQKPSNYLLVLLGSTIREKSFTLNKGFTLSMKVCTVGPKNGLGNTYGLDMLRAADES